MPILLWHLPLVIFFGSWDVAVSPSEKGRVEARLDAQSARQTPELSPFGNLAVEAVAAWAGSRPNG
jgi:hypothetical protein